MAKNKENVIKVELRLSAQDIQELIELLSRIGEEKISKYQAMQYINCNSTRTFDRLIERGKLPKGKRQIGFKELFWRKSEIDDYVQKIKDNNV